jgi:hypothetical protein
MSLSRLTALLVVCVSLCVFSVSGCATAKRPPAVEAQANPSALTGVTEQASGGEVKPSPKSSEPPHRVGYGRSRSQYDYHD